jgi:hypothetical protein
MLLKTDFTFSGNGFMDNKYRMRLFIEHFYPVDLVSKKWTPVKLHSID